MKKSNYWDVYGQLMKGGTNLFGVSSSAYVGFGKDDWMNMQASGSGIVKCNRGEQVGVIGSNWGGAGNRATYGQLMALLVHRG